MIERFLPNPRVRALVLAVAAFAVTLLVAFVLMPGRGAGGRGTPTSQVFAGVVQGASLATTACGIVLLYRTLRIINFAAAAIGVTGTILLFEFLQYTEVPFPIALAIAVATSGLIGVVIGVVMLRFFNSSRLFLTVVTTVSAGVIGGLGQQVRSLPFFPPLDERGSADFAASQDPRGLLPFEGLEFHVGQFPLEFGFAHLLTLELFAVTMLGLWAFLRFTKAGTAIRSLAENAERAALLGVGVGGLSIIVWGVAGVLSGVGLITNAAINTPGSVTGVGVSALLAAFAAAVIGRMQSLPITVGAAFAIAVLERAWDHSFQDRATLFDLFLFLAIAAALLLQRQRGRSEAGAGVSWSATDEVRPIPHVLRAVPAVRITRWTLIAIGVIGVVVYPFLVSTRNVSLGGVIALQAVAVVSLVVLTGWTGQVSLAQFAFVAIGAVVGGSLMENTFLPFWFAVPLAAAIAGVVAVIVGIPALRIPGLFLLVASFAFAVVVQSVLFDERYFDWLLPSSVERPSLFIVDFENERAMYYLSVATLVLAVVIVFNLRRSRIGRTLIALRENEANARSFGVRATRTKLVAFGIAGALCGMAGAVLAAHGRAVSANSFTAEASVDTFMAAVFGGVSSPVGALLGSAYFTILDDLGANSLVLQAFLQRGGTLLILFFAPGGLIQLITTVRDSALRVVAQRRQLVVPSLFADLDEDAIENRLIPLGEADPSSGLGALPATARFSLRSELYEGRGERIIDRLKPKRATRDAEAMAAAAKAAEETGAAPA